MPEKTPAERVAEIRKRLKAYHEHKNDPYAYYIEEIEEVGAMYANAPADIEFLLSQIPAA